MFLLQRWNHCPNSSKSQTPQQPWVSQLRSSTRTFKARCLCPRYAGPHVGRGLFESGCFTEILVIHVHKHKDTLPASLWVEFGRGWLKSGWRYSRQRLRLGLHSELYCACISSKPGRRSRYTSRHRVMNASTWVLRYYHHVYMVHIQT